MIKYVLNDNISYIQTSLPLLIVYSTLTPPPPIVSIGLIYVMSMYIRMRVRKAMMTNMTMSVFDLFYIILRMPSLTPIVLSIWRVRFLTFLSV